MTTPVTGTLNSPPGHAAEAGQGAAHGDRCVSDFPSPQLVGPDPPGQPVSRGAPRGSVATKSFCCLRRPQACCAGTSLVTPHPAMAGPRRPRGQRVVPAHPGSGPAIPVVASQTAAGCPESHWLTHHHGGCPPVLPGAGDPGHSGCRANGASHVRGFGSAGTAPSAGPVSPCLASQVPMC